MKKLNIKGLSPINKEKVNQILLEFMSNLQKSGVDFDINGLMKENYK